MTERMNPGLSSMYSSRASTAGTIRLPDTVAATNLFRSPSNSRIHFRVSPSSLDRRLRFSDSFRPPPVTILFHDDVSVMAALTLLFYRVHFASKKAACLPMFACDTGETGCIPVRNSLTNYHCRIFTASSYGGHMCISRISGVGG